MTKTIYFLRGYPTEEQFKEARDMGAVFRNPDAIGIKGDFFEDCENVCGKDIPDAYKHKPVLNCTAASIRKTGGKQTPKPLAQLAPAQKK